MRENLAAGDLVAGREGQRGGKVLSRRPLRHIGAAFSNKLQCGIGAKTGDPGDIDTRQ